MNRNTDSAYNDLATFGRTLSWLQDPVTGSVWTNWGVTYRDVRILDSRNQLSAVYNLTSYNLEIADNREALKALLLQAAQFIDTDGDDLGDDWEMLNFGNLTAATNGDFDGDGQDNFFEYAYGSSPTNAASKVSFQTALIGTGANRRFTVTFRRRLGSGIEYLFDTSPTAAPWVPSQVSGNDPVRNLFDGTGAGLATCTLPAAMDGPVSQFLRLRARPGPGARE